MLKEMLGDQKQNGEMKNAFDGLVGRTGISLRKKQL